MYLQAVFVRNSEKFFVTAFVVEQADPPVKSVQIPALGNRFGTAAGTAAIPPSAPAAFFVRFLEFSAGTPHFPEKGRIGEQFPQIVPSVNVSPEKAECGGSARKSHTMHQPSVGVDEGTLSVCPAQDCPVTVTA